MYNLKSVVFNKVKSNFPYNLPFFNNKIIDLEAPIIILVGENGTGKSTFIELLNEVLNLFRINMENPYQKDLKELYSLVSKHIKLKYSLMKPKGFFFSAEDFTSYIHYLVKEKNNASAELKRINSSKKSSLSKNLSSMPHNRTINEIDNLYTHDLLKLSHGEAYLSFFNSRVREKELYLLDEPETPLSIQNQLSLNYIINEGVKNNCQFIIATHSPIIMSLPNAKIYEINNREIKLISYKEIESVNLLKQFLNYPDSFSKHLYK